MSDPYDNGRSGWASVAVSDLFAQMHSYDRLPEPVRRLLQESVVPWNPDSIHVAANEAAQAGYAPHDAWRHAARSILWSEQAELLDFGATQWGGQSAHQRAGATIQRYGARGPVPQRLRRRRWA